MKIGYARVSTAAQDSSIQVDLLVKEGVDRDRIYVDHGISGRQTQRPGLDNAINAAREGDTFCVTKSTDSPDPRAIFTRRSSDSPPKEWPCRSTGRSTTRPIRWAKCSSASSD